MPIGGGIRRRGPQPLQPAANPSGGCRTASRLPPDCAYSEEGCSAPLEGSPPRRSESHAPRCRCPTARSLWSRRRPPFRLRPRRRPSAPAPPPPPRCPPPPPPPPLPAPPPPPVPCLARPPPGGGRTH